MYKCSKRAAISAHPLFHNSISSNSSYQPLVYWLLVACNFLECPPISFHFPRFPLGISGETAQIECEYSVAPEWRRNASLKKSKQGSATRIQRHAFAQFSPLRAFALKKRNRCNSHCP